MDSVDAKSITVYTAIFGGYDRIRAPKKVNRDVRYLCFTDRSRYVDTWKMVVQDRQTPTAVRDARLRKILVHNFVDTEYSIWLDGNLRLLVDPVWLVRRFLTEHDLALFIHCERDCAYEEAETSMLLGKANAFDILRQMGRYRTEGYPEHNGLTETSILIRRHTNAVRKFNERWWEEIENETHRDQLSFNYVCWKTGMKYNGIEGNFRYGGTPWLQYYVNHRK